MNRFKRFALVALCVVCAFCCAVFSGCSTSYTIVSESFTKEDGIIRYYVSLSMNSGEYEIDFTVCSRDVNGNVIDRVSFQKTVVFGAANFAYVSAVFTTASAVKVNSVILEKMRVVKRDNYAYLNVIPIVCGSVSSAVGALVIILFVLDKKGKLKK